MGCMVSLIKKLYSASYTERDNNKGKERMRTKRSDVDHTELPANTPHLPFIR